MRNMYTKHFPAQSWPNPQVDMEKVCKETFCWDSVTRAAWSFQGLHHQSRSLHCSEPRKATSSKGNSAAPAGHSQQHFLPAVCFFLPASASGAFGGMRNTTRSAYQLQGGNRNTFMSKQMCVFFSKPFLYTYLLATQRSSLCH